MVEFILPADHYSRATDNHDCQEDQEPAQNHHSVVVVAIARGKPDGPKSPAAP